MTGMRILPALALMWLVCPSLVLAWGQEGHQLIAKIATARLHPAAAREIAGLLEEGETLASVSTWGDEIRSTRTETAPWHYINFPVTARIDKRGWRAYCPPAGCVLSAVEDSLRTLRDRKAGRSRRAEALKFLVHFVGELHQPLHSADRGDRGGNDVQVVFNGQAGSLHRAWDTLLVREWLSRPGTLAQVEEDNGGRDRRKLSKGKPVNWAIEAHAIARDMVYSPLPAASPAVLSNAYLEQAGPVITLQLRRAGYRLARLLNETLAR